jgi:hypothetical protein
MNVVPDSIMSQVLTAILLRLGTAVTGLVHIHLFKNNFTPTKNSILADFTELTNVDVPGYAASPANWFAGVPHRLPTGAWEAPDSLADPSFVATGPPPAPIVVYGFFATDSTDAILLGSGDFTTPYTFQKTGDGFVLEALPLLIQSDGVTLTVTLPDMQPA